LVRDGWSEALEPETGGGLGVAWQYALATAVPARWKSSAARLPDARHGVRVEDRVCRHDGGAFADRLRREQAVKGVVVDRRERVYRPCMNVGDR